MYIVTALGFFMAGGLLALLMRAELAQPGMQFLDPEQYNQLFTMHGTIMLLLYATPIVFGFANFVVPLQIGAPDVAFPRLNAFSYWLYLFGALITVSGFATPGGAPEFGWTAYAPLNSISNSPQVSGDLWAMGLVVAGIGTILGAVNMITTIICLRCPGMTMWRMPVFTWEILATAVLILIAFPVLTAALLGLEADRHLRIPRVRPGQRRGDSVAASVLVLRAPRGVHRGVAVLRHRDRNLPGVLPQARLRLPRAGVRHLRYRGPVRRGLGTPHVRHRSSSPALLQFHDVPHRHPHRH